MMTSKSVKKAKENGSFLNDKLHVKSKQKIPCKKVAQNVLSLTRMHVLMPQSTAYALL